MMGIDGVPAQTVQPAPDQIFVSVLIIRSCETVGGLQRSSPQPRVARTGRPAADIRFAPWINRRSACKLRKLGLRNPIRAVVEEISASSVAGPTPERMTLHDGGYRRRPVPAGALAAFPSRVRAPASLRTKAAAEAMTVSSSSRAGPRTAHSQTVRTRQRAITKAARAASSRCWFAAIFSRQNSLRVSGKRNIGQSWPCQKQPCTRATA